MKEKSVAFCFLKSKTKEKANFSEWSKGGDFSVEILGVFF